MIIKNKLESQKLFNGKVLKYINSELLHRDDSGRVTDFYEDEDGKLYSFTRIPTPIYFPKKNRHSAQDYIETLGIDIMLLIEGIIENCSDHELDRLVLKCKHSIEHSKMLMEKSDTDDVSQKHFDAVNEQVNQTIDESLYSVDLIMEGLERALTMPSMQNMAILHNIIKLKVFNYKEEQKESENQ